MPAMRASSVLGMREKNAQLGTDGTPYPLAVKAAQGSGYIALGLLGLTL